MPGPGEKQGLAEVLEPTLPEPTAVPASPLPSYLSSGPRAAGTALAGLAGCQPCGSQAGLCRLGCLA